MFYFRNYGELPITAITTLGVSVKENDSPIGRFGTGLKYVTAGVLRLNERIEIISGGRLYRFSSKAEMVRGKTFNIVHMQTNNDPPIPLGFTTDLGKHWETWMLIRELWSNCTDEGGVHAKGDPGNIPDEETCITIAGPELMEAYCMMDEYILPADATVLLEGVACDFYPLRPDNVGSDTIFYQNIRVAKLEAPLLPMYRYNFKGHMLLTEDRTVTYFGSLMPAIAQTLMDCKDEYIIRRFICMGKDYRGFEADAVRYLGLGRVASVYYNLVETTYRRSPISLNPYIYSLAHKKWGKGRKDMTFTPTKVEQSKFDKALIFIQRLGFDKPIDFNFVEPDDNKSFGFVEDGNIYLTRLAFSNGTQFLAQTMIEEYAHAVLDEQDYSRGFQDFLLAKLVAIGEELVGDAL